MSYRFASLSSGLLARKGAAQPAMTSHSGGNPLRMAREEARAHAPLEESMAAPAAAPVFRPAAALARAGYAFESGPPPFPSSPRTEIPLAVASPRGVETGGGCGSSPGCNAADGPAADPARRFHVSVRLRQSHFVRLKIASAQLRKPSQDIVGEALEKFFRSLDPGVFGDCACAREI